MPYIKKEDREQFDRAFSFDIDAAKFPKNAGELNYVLTKICIRYFKENGGRYQQINDVIGALEGCKLEFYRKLVGPYEDTKIKEIGDCY
jgi:hypothetical protein